MKQEGLCGKYQDVQRYHELCSKGILYEELARTMDATRTEAKQAMMELAFSSHRSYSTSKKQFREIFPNVADHIDEFKKTNTKSSAFSIELQQLEAEIFIDNLYPTIKDQRLFCLTKHDSVIVKRKDKDRILQIIKEYFKSLDFSCTLSVQDDILHVDMP